MTTLGNSKWGHNNTTALSEYWSKLILIYVSLVAYPTAAQQFCFIVADMEVWHVFIGVY